MKGIDSHAWGAIRTKTRKSPFGFFVLPFLFVVFLSSCTNHGMKISRGPSSTFSQVSVTQTTGDFSLIQVSPDPINPGSLYALIGQNQEIEQYCNSTGSTCVCEFSFQQPGIGAQILSVAPTYIESDMLRCPNQVPSGIESFDVRLKTVPAQAGGTVYASNKIAYTLGSGSNPNLNSAVFLDLSDKASYMPVQRYQCRKREFVPNPLDNGILDPFQANDPRNLYPFNYYTTNVSESLLQMQRGNVGTTTSGGSGGTNTAAQNDQSWDCTLNSTPDGKLHWWANPAVYSRSPCPGGSHFCSGDSDLMTPISALSSGPIPTTAGTFSATGKRRSSFSLAKRAYGVFQTPVIAAIAPRTYLTSVFSTATNPLGWAAKPIPAVNGSSSCPSITLPAGARWVKLWNFRATSIPPGQMVSQTASANNSAVACRAPASFRSCQDAADAPTLPAPHNTTFHRRSSGFYPALGDSFTNPQLLAARVLMPTTGSSEAGACFMPNASSGNVSETWSMSGHKFNDSVSVGQMQSYPWGIYGGTGIQACPGTLGKTIEEWMTNAGSCAAFSLTDRVPTDSLLSGNVVVTPFSTDSYTDNLFVVTDPEVSDSQMMMNTPNEYSPVTFRSKAACSVSGDPTTPSSTRCTTLPSEYLGSEISWLISRSEVNAGTNSGPPAYPLCVVQFAE
jgi:hypothetical protein